MNLYRFGPLALASSVSIPELQLNPSEQSDAWRFVLSRRRRPALRARWVHRWSFPDGRPWAAIGVCGASQVVRFARTATFVVDGRLRRIVAHRSPGVPAPTIRHLLLDQVLPLVLSTGPHLVVHASAVRHKGSAVAFLGPSGVGKSTVAAVLSRDGGAAITDDCLVVDVDGDRPRIVPTYAGLRLWPDAVDALFPRARTAAVAHYTRKRRFNPPGVPRGRAGASTAGATRDPVPLGALCVLVRPRRAAAAPRAVRLRGHEAFAAVLGCTFQFDCAGRRAASQALDAITSLLASVPAYRIEMPSGLKKLDAMQQLVATLTVG